MSAEAKTQSMDETELERTLALVMSRGLPVAVLVATGVVGYAADAGTAILVLAGGSLLAVIAFLWASVRTLGGDAPTTIEEAFAVGGTSADDQKRAVLQALRDLEQEKALGKIDDADYQELSRRYRAEAKRLLKNLEQDRAPLREKAAAWAEARLAGRPTPKLGECACGTSNDADAAFCKRCGARLGVANAS